MAKASESKVEVAIQKLQNKKKDLPPFNLFGDDNYGAIDLGIRVLEEREFDEGVVEEWDSDCEKDWALAAVQYLNGEIELKELLDE